LRSDKNTRDETNIHIPTTTQHKCNDTVPGNDSELQYTKSKIITFASQRSMATNFNDKLFV